VPVTGAHIVAGRYVLRGVIGTGGMATVWRASDEVLGRDVAVKVLSPQLAADPAFAARFEREARHAAGLSHPNLVTVFDSGVDGTLPFIVMELVEGRTLRQVLDEARVLPAGHAVGIAIAVCEALEAAHSAGIVHRDITPANIVLAAGGGVKVLDFGIARIDGARGGTRTMAVIGTAAYLSPEQASGHPAGPQADLYSLGCVLFEMLTGTPPFAADTAMGLAYRQVHDDPGPPSARRAGLPVRLDELVARLLAKNPADRPASAAAARAGLLAALNPDTTAVLGPLASEQPASRTDQRDAGRPGAGQYRLDEYRAGHYGADKYPAEEYRAGRSSRWRPRAVEAILAAALAVTLAALAAVLLTSAQGNSGAAQAPPRHAAKSHSATPASRSPAARQRPALPPAAAAAAAFVGDVQAGVADGQVTPQAGQELFKSLQQLLFQAPDQNPQRVQNDFLQLARVYDERRAQGQITGPAAAKLRHDLRTIGITSGAI
jgi:hypothetical protein